MALEDVEGLLESLRGAADALSDISDVIDSLRSASTAAASSVQGIADAGKAAEGGAKGLLSMADAAEKLKKQAAQDAINKKNEETMRAAAKAMGMNGEEADKLIGKKKALQEAIGGSMGNALMAAQQLGGPLASVASKVQNIASLLGRVPPQVAAIIAAIVVLTAVVGGAAAAIYKMGESAIDVVQKASMLRSVLGALHGSADVGGKLQGLINSLGTKLPFATDKIAEWAKSLSMVAQNSKQLESMIKATAAAQAIMGDSGASAAQKMFETLGRGGAAAVSLVNKLQNGLPDAREELAALGLKIGDVAKALGMTEAQFKRSKISADQMNQALQNALQQKGAGPLAEMASTWPVIWMKAKEGFMSLFDALGPAVKPFMNAVKSLFGEFSKGGVITNALKPIITGVFTKLFEWGTKALEAIHKGLLYIVIGALTAYIALKPLLTWLADFLTSANMLRGVAVILTLMAIPFVVLGAVLLIVLATIGIIIGIVFALAAAFVYAVGAVVGFVSSIVSAFADAYSAATGAGGNFVDGLVAGISAGVGKVVEAVTSLASSALGAFTGALGIHSPSTVMLEHGEENIAGAAAMGIDKGSGKVKASMRALGDGPEGGGKGKGRGKGGGRDGDVIFDGCNFFGTSEDQVRKVWRKVLEELAGEAGGAPAEAT